MTHRWGQMIRRMDSPGFARIRPDSPVRLAGRWISDGDGGDGYPMAAMDIRWRWRCVVCRGESCRRIHSPLFALRSTTFIPHMNNHVRDECCRLRYMAQRLARAIITSTPRCMSWTATHSSGPWALCPPVKTLGVGRPRSVKREPSVPPRTGSS